MRHSSRTGPGRDHAGVYGWRVLRAVALWLGCSLSAPALAATTAAAAPGPAFGEIPRLRILGVEHGLPSSNITGITRDRSGYVWLATSDGLARYDGIDVRVWRHVPGDPRALPGNYITAVHVDAQDRVWAAVEGFGLSLLDADRKGFRHFRQASLPGIGSDDVWALTSREGVLWFGTFGGGLHRLVLAGDGAPSISRYMPESGNRRSLPSETVLSLRFDDAGRLWVGTTAGLARWTGRDFERLALPGSEPAPTIFSVVPDGQALWVGAGSGAFRLEPDGRWHVPPWSAMFAFPNAIFDVAADEDGQHWVASHRQLWRVAPEGVPYPVPIGANGPVRAIFQMLRQDDGALWVPVPGAGLGFLRPGWRRLAQYSREHGGLAGELYRAVMPAREGGVWLVGGRGEVERLGRDGIVRPLAEPLLERLHGRRLTAGVQDRAGRLWLGEHGALIRVDVEADTADGVREWRTDAGSDAPMNAAIALLQLAPDGSVWLACPGVGLQQRDPDSGRVLRTILPGPQQGLGIGDIEWIDFDGQGRLWVADERGLSRWDEAGDRLVPARGVVAGERVFAFAFDGTDALWLQRLGGLEHYRRSGERWQLVERVGVEQGIPALEAAALRIDRDHRVWLSTTRGLYRWDPRQRHARRFGVQDGLSSQEFHERAMALTDTGLLAAAVADGGVVLVDTLAADPPPVTPALHWDRLEVRRGGRWVTLAADPDTGWSLAPDDRELRVQLRLLAFDAPASNRYFTRLEGYDEDWVAQGHSGERVFAGLPPGTHTLHARAVDAVGNAAVEQVLSFRVQPPWWRTPWALAGAVGLLVLLGWWSIDAWRDRLRRRQAQQRAEHERHVAEQASLAKTRFLATLGHEVRTPMTGVLGMTELLLTTELDPEQRGYAQSIRQAGDHLLRLVDDALDLARIESGKLELTDEPFDLRALIDEAAALMAPLARQRGLEFRLEVAAELPRCVRGDAR
ncbi:MAG: hypothetical protein KY442_07975 [Proteobacteria bacterium]|nr:hypothetical protein [Pseudomonadota bacterium]